jgi:hypothetical protein
LLAGIFALWLTRQNVNLMTLGGLALAVGILVDEATVTIENIHTHLARGSSITRAARDATQETAIPRLLAMLCIVAVFIPAFFMTEPQKPCSFLFRWQSRSLCLPHTCSPARWYPFSRFWLLRQATHGHWFGQRSLAIVFYSHPITLPPALAQYPFGFAGLWSPSISP